MKKFVEEVKAHIMPDPFFFLSNIVGYAVAKLVEALRY